MFINCYPYVITLITLYIYICTGVDNLLSLELASEAAAGPHPAHAHHALVVHQLTCASELWEISPLDRESKNSDSSNKHLLASPPSLSPGEASNVFLRLKSRIETAGVVYNPPPLPDPNAAKVKVKLEKATRPPVKPQRNIVLHHSVVKYGLSTEEPTATEGSENFEGKTATAAGGIIEEPAVVKLLNIEKVLLIAAEKNKLIINPKAKVTDYEEPNNIDLMSVWSVSSDHRDEGAVGEGSEKKALLHIRVNTWIAR